MEILGLFIIILSLYLLFGNKNQTNHTNTSVVYRSNNGYESHLDFLEMNGFISAEEREDQQNMLKKMESGEYKTISYEELVAKYNQENP